MDVDELRRILLAPGSLWVRIHDECSGCEAAPVWLAVHFTNGELSSDWRCENCADPAWRAILALDPDPTLLTALRVGAPETCTSRPGGPDGPLCAAPAEYLALYLFGNPRGEIRVGNSCSSCVGELDVGVGSAVAVPLGLG